MRIPTITPDNPIYQINPAKQPKRYRSDEDEEDGEEQPLKEEPREEESSPPAQKKPQRPLRPGDKPGIDLTV